MLLRLLHVCLGRRNIPQRPRLPQDGVDRATHDTDARERALQHPHAAARGNDERHEDDVRLWDTVVEQHTDRHERCGARADLERESGESCDRRRERGRAVTHLRVEEEDEAVPGKVAFADAHGEHGVQQERLAGVHLGLDEQRADADVLDDATQALFERSSTARTSVHNAGGCWRSLRSQDGYSTDVLNARLEPVNP